jgi:DUF1680 family protein
LHALEPGAVRITGGFWGERQAAGLAAIKNGYARLEEAGNFHDLQLAAGTVEGVFRGPFVIDSDLHKWVEAAGWQLGNDDDAELRAMVDHVVRLLVAAQAGDGYLNSFIQVTDPEARWQNLREGHELYCAGHLFEAAIALRDGAGDHRLMPVAERFANLIVRDFADPSTGRCGHPEIELALVALHRATGEVAYLDIAERFLRRRGGGEWGAYYQDHVPVDQASEMVGHAVRQLYLCAGVYDLYVERPDPGLLEALRRQWRDLVERKLYVTGGTGARHEGETFGDPYELPSDRAYAETCAAVGVAMMAQRMLRVDGDPLAAEVMERALYNGFLAGLSLDGSKFFYVNPLSSRGEERRSPWYRVGCCPPNVMRTLAALGRYVATRNDDGIQLHLYVDAEVRTALAAGDVGLRMTTALPWDGAARVEVTRSPGEWTLTLRRPAWAGSFEVSLNGGGLSLPGEAGSVPIRRRWEAGDVLDVSMALPVLRLRSHPAVDATRGCVALQRGPLVYCAEGVDNSGSLHDLGVDPGAPVRAVEGTPAIGSATDLVTDGTALGAEAWAGDLYRADAPDELEGARREVRLVPYFAWNNRGPTDMRVWFPETPVGG